MAITKLGNELIKNAGWVLNSLFAVPDAISYASGDESLGGAIGNYAGAMAGIALGNKIYSGNKIGTKIIEAGRPKESVFQGIANKFRKNKPVWKPSFLRRTGAFFGSLIPGMIGASIVAPITNAIGNKLLPHRRDVLQPNF